MRQRGKSSQTMHVTSLWLTPSGRKVRQTRCKNMTEEIILSKSCIVVTGFIKQSINKDLSLTYMNLTVKIDMIIEQKALIDSITHYITR